MEKYEKLLNMLMDFNSDVRFAAVCDRDGEILWNSTRSNITPLVPMEDTKKTLKRAVSAWDERAHIAELVGRGMYTIAAYEKIKRITVPLSDQHVLFISVDNTPINSSDKKSYGHLVEIGKIMSIIDFVESEN